MKRAAIVPSALLLLLAACGRTPEPAGRTLTVAAAANLTGTMDEVVAAFERQTNVPVTVSYGSTAQLSQQIENGAPFDIFASADTEHVDALIAKGKLQSASRAVYASGQLALWIPDSKQNVQTIKDLVHPKVRFIAIAQPDLAPYGQAAVEALKETGLWEQVQPKVVYANNISMARQYAASGNADAAFTAFSLVMKDAGVVIKVDPKLHRPLDQALAITESTPRGALARWFAAFLLGSTGRSVLGNRGYLLP
jgi:molybdate transport system substrate-binding protein